MSIKRGTSEEVNHNSYLTEESGHQNTKQFSYTAKDCPKESSHLQYDVHSLFKCAIKHIAFSMEVLRHMQNFSKNQKSKMCCKEK